MFSQWFLGGKWWRREKRSQRSGRVHSSPKSRTVLAVEQLEDRRLLSSGIYVTAPAAGGAPQINVYDSATGAEKYSFMAYDPSLTTGVRVAVGDVTGNGTADIITGPGPGGGPDIRVFDGDTGRLLREFSAFNPSFSDGVNLATGDVNGDGASDIIVSADSGGGPNVTVFSGTDNHVLNNFFAYNPSFSGGVHLAAGDVNGSGHAQIITGPGPGGGPQVSVFNGVTGAQESTFLAFDPSFAGGVNVAAGDVQGTGQADVIAAAGPGGGPNVKVLNGTTGAQLDSFFAYDPAFSGGVNVSSADVAGHSEILTAPGQGGGPAVNAFDPMTGQAVDQFFAYDPSFTDGVNAAGQQPTAQETGIRQYFTNNLNQNLNSLNQVITTAKNVYQTDGLGQALLYVGSEVGLYVMGVNPNDPNSRGDGGAGLATFLVAAPAAFATGGASALLAPTIGLEISTIFNQLEASGSLTGLTNALSSASAGALTQALIAYGTGGTAAAVEKGLVDFTNSVTATDIVKGGEWLANQAGFTPPATTSENTVNAMDPSAFFDTPASIDPSTGTPPPQPSLPDPSLVYNPPSDLYPGTGSYNPGTGGYYPGTGSYLPGTGGSYPGTGGYVPGTSGYYPGTGGYYPGTGGYYPGTGGYDPGTGGYDPGAGSYYPGTGGYDPGDGGYDPGDGGYDPGDGGYDPGDGGYDPGSSYDPGYDDSSDY